MSGIDILMAADRAAGKILASLTGNKKMDELECVAEPVCGKEKCNITHFGVCCPVEGSPPPTEIITYKKTKKNSKDETTGKVTGFKCEPVIIGTWKNPYVLTRIVDNGDKNPADRMLCTSAAA